MRVRDIAVRSQPMSAKIPVFVSAPTALSEEQQTSYDFIVGLLDYENLERRALGRSDYPSDFPLKEIYHLARHCSGGIVLGYSQMSSKTVVLKGGTPEESTRRNVQMPTPWNHIEAGMMFAMRLPLMVFKEDGISGGIFDHGVTDVFINKLNIGTLTAQSQDQIKASLQFWTAKVREHYRAW